MRKSQTILQSHYRRSSKYLSLAQINGDVHGSEKLPQRVEENRCQRGSLIEHNLDNLILGFDHQKATDMEDIAHYAQDPLVQVQEASCARGRDMIQ